MVRIKDEKNFFNYFFFFTNLKAATIVDYETEIFINEIISIVSKANDYKNKIKFSIILDDNPNAYIDKDNNLFISTGLLKYINSYEALIGVIAHELGHLQNFHIDKRKDSSKNLKNLNNLSNLTVIAGSLLTSNSEYLLQSLLTKNIGISNYYQTFSREQEREADYYAIETLNKLKLSSDPLLNFLAFLEKKSVQKGISSDYYKFSSHPMYEERYKIIETKKKSQLNYHDKKLNKKFNYIRAKLFGFTENNTNIFNKYLKDDYLIYAKSINYSKKGELKKSMHLINQLLQEKENYNFILETKADILHSNGFFKESLLFYEKSLENNYNNYYVNKRIFDIKFLITDIDNKKLAKRLLNDYSYLLIIFYNNNDLKNKFKILAKNSDNNGLMDYFSILEKFNNKEIDQNIASYMLNEIKEISKDKNLINLINKFIPKNYEKK